MYHNTDYFLNQDLLNHHDFSDIDDKCDNTDISICNNCHAIIDDSSKYCDSACEESDYRHKQLKKMRNDG